MGRCQYVVRGPLTRGSMYRTGLPPTLTARPDHRFCGAISTLQTPLSVGVWHGKSDQRFPPSILGREGEVLALHSRREVRVLNVGLLRFQKRPFVGVFQPRSAPFLEPFSGQKMLKVDNPVGD